MGKDFIKEYYKPLDFCPSYSVQSIENFENNDRTYEAFDKWIRSKISATATNANQHIKGMVYEQKNNTRKNRKNNRKSSPYP